MLKTTILVIFFIHFNGGNSATWQEYGDYEYWFEENLTGKTWYQARDACNQDGQGAKLATIETIEEQLWIIQQLKDRLLSSGSWIGYTGQNSAGRRNVNMNWSWVDGSSSNFTAWSPGAVSLTGYQLRQFRCALVTLNPTLPATLSQTTVEPENYQTWNKSNCGERRPFICRRPKGMSTAVLSPTPPHPTQPAVPGYCPQGYTAAGNKCYKLFLADISFGDAKLNCQTQQGLNPGLATINNMLERDVVSRLMYQSRTGKFWIGLMTSDEGEWVWTDSSPTSLTYWAPLQPRYSPGYAYIKGHGDMNAGQWYSAPTSSTKNQGYVCQVSKDPHNVINTPPSTTEGGCPPGYTPYWYGCYKFISTPATWSNAKASCQQKGGDLVSIHTSVEQSAISSMRQVTNSDLWIGLSSIANRNVTTDYSWVDGLSVTYTDWGVGQPMRTRLGGGCVRLNNDDERWYDEECSKTLPYVCKSTRSGMPTTPTPAPNLVCPPLWVAWKNYCYFFGTQRTRPWHDAMADCARQHSSAYLTTIHSMEENDFIFNTMTAKKSSSYYNVWIGMYQNKKTSKYEWYDGESVNFLLWAPGQPSMFGNENICVHMRFSGGNDQRRRWMDTTCTTYSNYICKMPKISKPTFPTPVKGDCPSDEWIHYGDRCLLFKPDEFATWDTSLTECVRQGGPTATLVTFSDSYLDGYVHKTVVEMSALPVARTYWIGLVFSRQINNSSSSPGGPSTLPARQRRPPPGMFQWIYRWMDTGLAPTYTNWAENRPYNHGPSDSRRRCTAYDTNQGAWIDVQCTQMNGYVCQTRKGVVPPENNPKSPSRQVQDDVSKKYSSSDMAGVAIGVGIGVALLGVVLFFLYMRYIQVTRIPYASHSI